MGHDISFEMEGGEANAIIRLNHYDCILFHRLLLHN